jgi:hypothetical protein
MQVCSRNMAFFSIFPNLHKFLMQAAFSRGVSADANDWIS